jgi:hypothetical protein
MAMLSSSVSWWEQSIMMLSSATPCSAQSSARVMSSSEAAWSRCTAMGTDAAWHVSRQNLTNGLPNCAMVTGKSWQSAGERASSAARTSAMTDCAS